MTELKTYTVAILSCIVFVVLYNLVGASVFGNSWGEFGIVQYLILFGCLYLVWVKVVAYFKKNK